MKVKSLITVVAVVIAVSWLPSSTFGGGGFSFLDIKMMDKEKGKEIYREIKEVNVGQLFCLKLSYPAGFSKEEVGANLTVELFNEWANTYHRTSEITGSTQATGSGGQKYILKNGNKMLNIKKGFILIWWRTEGAGKRTLRVGGDFGGVPILPVSIEVSAIE